MAKGFTEALTLLMEKIKQAFSDSGIPLFQSIVVFILLYIFFHYVFLPLLDRRLSKKRAVGLLIVTQRTFFRRAVIAIQGMVLLFQVGVLPAHSLLAHTLVSAIEIWTMSYVLLSVYSLLDVIYSLIRNNQDVSKVPFRGIIQSLKLTATVIYLIFLISIFTAKSPVILLSGLSAIAAVLLLIFKDTILGLVAGIQLAVNRMVQLGDWIEMDKFSANGWVQDIGLTTVKVLNFDGTITTIPTYTLVSNAFKNWRSMSESGGRRITRSINIDVNSIHFLTEKEFADISSVEMISRALQGAPIEKRILDEHGRYLQDQNMTNLDLFQAYIKHFIGANEHIRNDMTLMVRQLSATAYGLPVEIYAFSKLTEFVPYEELQSSLVAHACSSAPLFNLKINQLT